VLSGGYQGEEEGGGRASGPEEEMLCLDVQARTHSPGLSPPASGVGQEPPPSSVAWYCKATRFYSGFVAVRFRAKRGKNTTFQGRLSESQGQNLGLTVLHMPSLDSGRNLEVSDSKGRNLEMSD